MTGSKFVSKFIKEDSGVSAIEYGLIAALISITIVAAVTAIGTSLVNKFNPISTALN